MRVITGSARGRKLKEPQGNAIRPTADAVKEAIFNICQFDVEGRRVLDLFGGTGIYLQLKNGTSNNFTLKKNHSYTLTLQSGTSGNVGADTVSGGASGM